MYFVLFKNSKENSYRKLGKMKSEQSQLCGVIPTMIHFTMQGRLHGPATGSAAVFGSDILPNDSYEARVSIFISFVDDTMLEMLYDDWIINLRFKNIAVAFNLETQK